MHKFGHIFFCIMLTKHIALSHPFLNFRLDLTFQPLKPRLHFPFPWLNDITMSPDVIHGRLNPILDCQFLSKNYIFRFPIYLEDTATFCTMLDTFSIPLYSRVVRQCECDPSPGQVVDHVARVWGGRVSIGRQV